MIKEVMQLGNSEEPADKERVAVLKKLLTARLLSMVPWADRTPPAVPGAC